MSNSPIKELFIEPGKTFAKHICQEGNEKIIFSGKFGKGKTTFLMHFFKSQKEFLNKLYYDAYFIDPVNYTVATNEDIFKYIKYDILLALLEKGKSADDVQFSNQEIAMYYMAEHPDEVVKAIVKYIPKVGKYLEALIDFIQPLHKKMMDFGDEIKNATESSRAIEFIKSLETGSYSIYENDIITKLIRILLESTNMINQEPEISNEKKENVLVIDNLDRIDPEHIFRILNIFSAHIDYRTDNMSTNKFGFDKVVIVCDINNIRSIFNTKYGTGVDFSGYIDKFYSIDIFYFQNYRQIAKTVHSLVGNLRIGFVREQTGALNQIAANHGIYNIITALVNSNSLGLREVFNFCTAPIIFDSDEFTIEFENEHPFLKVWDTPILEMMILAKMLGGAKELLKAMADLDDTNVIVSDFVNHARRLIFYDMRSIHKFESGDNFVYRLKDVFLNVSITMGHRGFNSISLMISNGNRAENYKVTLSDFYYLYSRVLKDIYRQKLIE